MNRIKVLYHFSGSGVLTGSPGALLRMVESLDRSVYEPAFMGSDAGPLADALRDRAVELTLGRVDSVSWAAPWTLIQRVRAQMQLLRRMKVGLVHLNEPGWNSDLVLAATLLKVPVALHLHNPQVIARSNLNFKLARKVFLCSEGQKAVIENAESVAAKFAVLHNAVDVDLYAKGRAIRSELQLPEDALVVGTVAQIGHRKGIDLFLDAAELLLDRHPALRFAIVGPPAVNESAYFDGIMSRLKSGRLKDAALYLGGRKDIPDVLKSFDIFFLPTRAEPFGMVIIEAMAASVPVVASHVGGIPEIIADASIGRTVPEMTAQGYAAALDELICLSDQARKALGQRGRDSISGRFDLQSMGRTLHQNYQQLLAG